MMLSTNHLKSKFRQGSTAGIRRQITASLAVMALLVMLMSLLALLTQYSVRSEVSRPFRSVIPAVNAIQTIRGNALLTQNVVRDHLLLEALVPASPNGGWVDEQILVDTEIDGVSQSYAEVQDALRTLEALEGTAQTLELRTLAETFYRQSQAMLAGTSADTADTADTAKDSLQERLVSLEATEQQLLVLTEGEVTRRVNDLAQSTQTFLQVSLRDTLLSMLVMVVSIGLAVLIAYRLSRMILRPLDVFKRAAESLGRGHFPEEEHANLLALAQAPHEFGVLARVFVRMADDLKALHSTLIHSARHDVLTGLPNRACLLERLSEALAARDAQPFTLLFLDFDRFKAVNDRYGHKVGDGLLVEIAKRLKQCVRLGDLVARLGGDEFTILLMGDNEIEQAERAAQRILRAFERPCVIEGIEIRTSASIGILVDGHSCETAEDALRNADIAMYSAKNSGRSCYRFFSARLEQEVA